MPAAKDEPLSLLLRSFHLPTMARIAAEAMAQAQAKNWSHRELLLHLCESEAQERSAKKKPKHRLQLYPATDFRKESRVAL